LFLAKTARNFLPFEWVISFLPHIIVFNIGVLIVLLFVSPLLISFLPLFAITLLFLLKLINFSFVKPVPGTGSQVITIAFFNKLFYNTNYEEINRKIREINPDIIGMAELNGDAEKISLLTNYPYKFINNSRKTVGIGLFSKHKFITKDIPDPSHLISSEMDIFGKQYDVLVFHPNPPLYENGFEKRNIDLKNLNNYVKQLGSATILLGDFNITPWSATYTKFLSSLSTIKNTAKGMGFFLSFYKGPLYVFIDYIFVAKHFRVESFKTEYVSGSDHYLIWSVIKV
jgi:endonuclease/exonuclease/phosphatase (EEP) superfamily protein YafD